MNHDLLWFLLCLFFIFLFFGLLLSILFLRFIFWIIVCICLEERVDAIEERSQYIEMEMDGPIGKQRHHKGNQTLEEEAASVDDSLTLRMNHSSLFILFLLTLLFNILPIFLIILFILTLFFFFNYLVSPVNIISLSSCFFLSLFLLFWLISPSSLEMFDYQKRHDNSNHNANMPRTDIMHHKAKQLPHQ